jgi:hypothetical protein
MGRAHARIVRLPGGDSNLEVDTLPGCREALLVAYLGM